MQFAEVLRTFGEFFEREGIPYAVIGGLAMQAWGRSRFTKDLDIVVPRTARERVTAFAESIGYETLFAGPAFSNHLRNEEDRVDFMYVDDRTAGDVFGEAQRKPVVGDVTAPVASAEHLAMMKALSMKNAPRRIPYEGEDVRLLLSTPGVDRAKIREYFSRHGLLDLFDAIERSI